MLDVVNHREIYTTDRLLPEGRTLPGSTYEKEDPSELMTTTLLSEKTCFDKPCWFTTTLHRFTVLLLLLLTLDMLPVL